MKKEKNGISVVEAPLRATAAGPEYHVALIFQCRDSCQYLQQREIMVGESLMVESKCARENRLINVCTKEQGKQFPYTPDWCAFTDFAYKAAVTSVNNLMDVVESRSMFAIKLTSILADGQHPNQRKIKFYTYYGTKGQQRLVTSHLHVHHRAIVNDDRLIIKFVEYHPTERIALVEFPEEIMPGMSRRAWVRKDDLFNAPPL